MENRNIAKFHTCKKERKITQYGKKGEEMPHTKIFYKGISLAKYCKQNNIVYENVYFHIKNGKSVEAAIAIVTKTYTPDTPEELSRCIFCNRLPTTVEISKMFYTQCKCHKWNPYEFVGIRKATSIAQWNYANRPVPRDGNKKN